METMREVFESVRKGDLGIPPAFETPEVLAVFQDFDEVVQDLISDDDADAWNDGLKDALKAMEDALGKARVPYKYWSAVLKAADKRAWTAMHDRKSDEQDAMMKKNPGMDRVHAIGAISSKKQNTVGHPSYKKANARFQR